MKFAHLDKSPRLQRVRSFLADHLEHSTRDIVYGAEVMAVSACIAELRANGLEIHSRREGDIWYYRMGL
ncbi:MAG: hypothetical protein KGI54_18820 [Pseudomonadota bacterium]|nr:hypothetical protein [Pseudomonadota bacterium]